MGVRHFEDSWKTVHRLPSLLQFELNDMLFSEQSVGLSSLFSDESMLGSLSSVSGANFGFAEYPGEKEESTSN